MAMYLTCPHCSGVARQTNADAWFDDSDPCDACCIHGGVSSRVEDGAEFVPDDDALCVGTACVECNGRRAASACGWAFDAGMREAEVEAARSLWLGGREATAAAVAAERARCVEIDRVRMLPDFPGESGPDCSESECIACQSTKAIESGESAEAFTARVEALRAKWLADDESGVPAPREG